ncbi:restriction endonuclease subunit S [Ruminococcus sp. AF19-15]|nr:restriction endonuclease subunit S [Ruminococcus sp. AF19-15]
MPYAFCEQIGKEIRDISDEIPFEIPDSWEWVRFSNLVNFSMGKTPPRKETEYWENPIYPWVSIADMPADGTVLSTKEKVNQYAADNTFKSGISPIGTLIMSFKLTVGKVSILGIDAYHNEAIISIFPFVDDDRIVTSYLFKVLPLIAQNGDTKTAIKGATLNSDSLSNLLIPLPPLTEQKRIVNRIVELEPYVSAYDIAETHLTALNTTFPEALKKSILQEAVQGKLVPQNPDDEPASVLLERIRAEKQALIKTGKIKKDKHESAIITRDKIPYEIIDGKERCIADEVPFEIPDSWCWCRLGSIIQIESGKGLTSKQMIEGSIPVYGGNGITGYHNASLVHKETVVIGRVGYYCGSVHITEKEAWVTDNAFITTYPENSIYREYLVYTLRYMNLGQNNNATAQPVVSGKKIYPMLFPLPPLAEQHRIVAKIEEIMPMIERLTLR